MVSHIIVACPTFLDDNDDDDDTGHWMTYSRIDKFLIFFLICKG